MTVLYKNNCIKRERGRRRGSVHENEGLKWRANEANDTHFQTSWEQAFEEEE